MNKNKLTILSFKHSLLAKVSFLFVVLEKRPQWNYRKGMTGTKKWAQVTVSKYIMGLVV